MYIKSIELCSANIQQTAGFYTTTLQLPLLHQSSKGVTFAAGNTLLTFKQYTQPASPVYHFAFNISPNQLAAAVGWAREKLALLPVTPGNIIADFEQWHAHAFYCYDNNGNILEFIARHDLPEAATTAFSGAAVLSISEIGIVTDNVSGCMQQLMTECGLPVFARQPPKENFTALGDDHGLLIISESNRHWFPTEVPAQRFPVKVVLQQGGHTRELTV